MELHERIAFVRRAAGLSQEALGEKLGVTRQAVSKWESGQSIPDAATAARLCQELHISADFLLLGKEPEDGASPPPPAELPDVCPVCGRALTGTQCSACDYTPPATPPRGPHYAVVGKASAYIDVAKCGDLLVKYCSFSDEPARLALLQSRDHDAALLLRRDLTDHAARYLAARLAGNGLNPRIVLDENEENDDALLTKPAAIDTSPASAPSSSSAPVNEGMGFGGTVLATMVGVIAALLILSFF